MLGIQLPDEQSVVSTVQGLAQRFGETNLITLTVGLLSIAAIVLLSRALPRLPGSPATVAAATLFVYLLGLDGKGVDIVGEVP